MKKLEKINPEVRELVQKAEQELSEVFLALEQISLINTEKVLSAFQEHQVSEAHLGQTTGYGYNDLGRDTIEKIFASVLGSEDALVRGQFISGSHALTVTLFALLRPGDTLLSISGKPYDTLDEVIGIKENKSSLLSFGIHYEQIELIDNEFDIASIQRRLRQSPVKVIEIQRSRGYSTRKSISIDAVERVIQAIREVDQTVIIMIDNCYCEFVSSKEPTEVGADIMVGSLIKNLGGGIAPNGAYVAGRGDLIELVACRLTLPGEGREVGPSLGMNRLLLQGLYFAPSVVLSSMKTAVLTSYLLEKLGYTVDPQFKEERSDIVQTISFQTAGDLISYCQGIQMGSAIDSFAIPIPGDMPGYLDQVIMASGSFTQGSSIELSCDGPIRPPYLAYQQGSLTYPYGRLGVMVAISNLLRKKKS